MSIIINNYSRIYHFNPLTKPIKKIKPGAEIEVFTSDASDGQIKNFKNNGLMHDFNIKLDNRRANPATGPIEVIGAYPGNTLKIKIKAVETAQFGYMGMDKENQILGKYIGQSKIKLFKIKNNKVYFNPKRSFDVRPMVGVIGTTPGRSIKTNLAGKHGGNMDNRFITTDSIVYLPVFLKGALFAIGDIHAAMGDGEILGCGVEVAGKVIISIGLLKNISINFPIVETNKEWIISGESTTIKGALRIASGRLIEILEKYFNMDMDEALYFLSAYANFGLCQSAFMKALNQVVVRVIINKDILDFSRVKNYGVDKKFNNIL